MSDRINVYLLKDPARHHIHPGSGIVGSSEESQDAADDVRVRLDYEGNLHGAMNIVTYADRVHVAWGRHTANDGNGYPTIARVWLPAVDLVHVGVFDSFTGEVDIDPEYDPLVADWIGAEQLPADEMICTAGHYTMRRECAGALRSPDLRVREAGKFMQRRYNIQISR